MGTSEKEALTFTPTHQVFLQIDNILLLSLRFSGLSSLSAPPFVEQSPNRQSSSRTFTGVAPACLCLSCTGGPRAEKRGRLTSPRTTTTSRPSLLVRVFLMQPRRPRTFFASRMRCWLMVSLLPAGTPRLPLQSCFPSGLPPACTSARGYSLQGAGLCISLCWTSQGLPLPSSPACVAPLKQHNHLVCQPLFPALHCLKTPWGALCTTA